MKYYAVKNGRNPGIYQTWDECKEQVHGFEDALYKSFQTLEEANKFMNGEITLKNIHRSRIATIAEAM